MEEPTFDYESKVFGAMYDIASKTGEQVQQPLAADFAGPLTWSKAVDFPAPVRLPSGESLRGFRFIDFKDCTNQYVVNSKDEARSFYALPLEDRVFLLKHMESFAKQKKAGQNAAGGLDGVLQSMDQFFKWSAVKGLDVVDTVPGSFSQSKRQNVYARRNNAWCEQSNGQWSVSVFGPNVSGFDKAYWQGLVLKAALESFGLGGLCPDKGNADLLLRCICTDSNKDYRSMRDLQGQLRALQGQPQKYMSALYPVAKSIASVFGFEDRFLLTAVRNGLNSFFYNQSKTLSTEDRAAAKEKAAEKVDLETAKYLDLSGWFSVGVAGEAFKRMGYPAVEMSINGPRLQMMFADAKIDSGGLDLDELARKIADPLVVFEAGNPSLNGSRSYVMVTDLEFRSASYGNKFLAFKAAPPKDAVQSCLRAMEERKIWSLNLYPITLSERQVLSQLAANNIKYLKPRGDVNSTFFEIGARLDRDKKIGTAPSPVATSGSNAPLLYSIANIVNNFRNPISSERFFQLHGYHYDPIVEAMDRRAEIIADKEALAKREEAARLKAAVSEWSQAKGEDKMIIPIPKHVIGEAAYGNLRKEGICNVGDVVHQGFERVREVAGTDKAVNKLAEWMQERNIFVFPKRSVRASEGVPTLEEVRIHMTDTLLRSGKYDSVPVQVPRRLNGEYYTGSDAIHLMAMGTLPRLRECPIWCDRNELEKYGCSPLKAEPVPVGDSGERGYVYNLARTEFPQRYPHEYAKLVETGRRYTPVTGAYFDTLLSGIRCVTRDKVDSLADYLNHSSSKAFVDLRINSAPDLKAVVGEQSVKDMERKGKIRMMNTAVGEALGRARQRRIK